MSGRAPRRAITAALLAAGLAAAPTTAATAKGGVTDGWGSDFYLSNTFSASASIVYTYGDLTDYFFVGNWDGKAGDSLAYRSATSNVLNVRNAHSSGGPTYSFAYGRADDELLVGDWNGDGTDTLAVRRGNEYHVKNSLTGGGADRVFHYGREDDLLLVGDFDGDGRDTFTVRRGNDYHVNNSLAGGDADKVVRYGRVNDRVYVGDFDGEPGDSFAVRRRNAYHIANDIRSGDADLVVTYGRPTDGALVGDWDGDGTDSLGVQRLKNALDRTPDGWVTDVSGADLSAARYDSRNGRLDHRVLCEIPFQPSHAVHCTALPGLVKLNSAYEARFGEPLPVDPAPYSTYRAYEHQLHVWEETGPPIAARPGTSPHGWGLSMDLGNRWKELEFGEQPYLWLHANAPRYGWRNQSWNQENGSNPEPWHFDYVG